MKRSQIDYASSLPDVLTSRDIELSRRMLGAQTLEVMEDWTRGHLEVFEYGGRDFRMLVDRGEDIDMAIATFGEFGTHLVGRFAIKSQIARQMTAPNASLVAQVNSIVGENNMNYSRAERRMLASGKMDPLIGRVAVVMDAIGQPSDITLAGTSQGAVAALAYGSNADTPPAAVAAIELPTVVQRTPLALMRDFASQQNDLVDVVEANFSDENDFLSMLKKDSHIGLADTPNMIKRLAHPDSLAVVRGMSEAANAGDQIRFMLDQKPQSALVHVWGDADRVSPSENNQALANKLAGRDNYRWHIAHGLSHAALTDYYPLYGALVRDAYALRHG